ncbi:hypothetical protein [Granulibacter bethesdensis]|uniref:Uncharacterized protein n=1 Tax=Granulibacter bethesdensis (strain ATCC BAA-1260 / CGDNIH1) TaxID=391165 RepID=Q0BTV4_GRABC|nr:hypothetical protein [Granulibacter bethesdensis]ABI61748.1 Hypothetical protein GbCGDNIH1_0850 [Granulibacter bethesdensis CGDNIH1]APH51557.1 Hypothetical protein GbCGDNIH5_0850 [Granulibacter bethesdensis]APH64250.1 Hypothetical protein GbCGDNIH1I4_0850 [Granulibacter bethesdensis]
MQQLLKAAVILMGVLIIAGVVALAILIPQRMGGAGWFQQGAQSISVPAPSGSRIASVGLSDKRLALHLQGGGPDRVVIVDMATGAVRAQIVLAPQIPEIAR